MALPSPKHLLCIFEGEKHRIPHKQTASDLRKAIAEKFHLDEKDILGLRSDNVAYPISFIAKYGQGDSELFQDTCFELIYGEESEEEEESVIEPTENRDSFFQDEFVKEDKENKPFNSQKSEDRKMKRQRQNKHKDSISRDSGSEKKRCSFISNKLL